MYNFTKLTLNFTELYEIYRKIQHRTGKQKINDDKKDANLSPDHSYLIKVCVDEGNCTVYRNHQIIIWPFTKILKTMFKFQLILLILFVVSTVSSQEHLSMFAFQ